MTINTGGYVQLLRKFWTAHGRQKEVVKVRQWFQQDGATPYTSKESLPWLNQRFSDQLISRKCDLQWSPYSPDLNPPDFYLFNDRIYVHNPQNIPDLKREIKTTIKAIPRSQTILFAEFKFAYSAKVLIF